MMPHKCQWHDLQCDKTADCLECERFPDNEDKPNFTAEPMQALREDSYGVTITVCPACHEPAYEEGRCIFCGQRYTEPEIPPESRPTIKGGHYAEDGNMVCDTCGHSLFDLISHGDGPTVYINTLRCVNCGATIQMIHKRRCLL